MRASRLAFAASIALSLIAPPTLAAEGMWTFDKAPLAKIRAETGAALDPVWLDRVRGGAVRLTNGCSASLVSQEGLVATNHHCVVECVQNLSTSARNYVEAGFVVGTRPEEQACPGMQAEVLLRITDVTPAINAASANRTGAAYVEARERAKAAAEAADCGADPALRCQTVAFHGEHQFKVYRYRKYSDVRLAFAPERAIAFFGGDPDNFTFPRFNLDVAFLRVYESGAPARTPGHLRWNASAPTAGEAVFTVGNPGGTSRALTMAQLRTQRDVVYPLTQLHRAELRGRLIQFGGQSAEQQRVVTDPLYMVENSYKANAGEWAALLRPSFMEAKAAEETRLRRRLASDPTLYARFGDPWKAIEAAQADYEALYPAYRLVASRAGGGSQLYNYAVTLVRAARERAKPDASRAAEYVGRRLELMEQEFTAAVPIDPALERVYLEFWLLKVREALGPDAPAVRELLGKESPEGLAASLSASALADPETRRALWQGGLPAVTASKDPLIQYVLRVDPLASNLREQWRQRVEGPVDIAESRLAAVRFAIDGATLYPDATFTLRLSFGRVEGWSWQGRTIPPLTRFSGLYERATGADPYALPPRWLDGKARLNPETVFNFTTTNDIVGGNSGSPVVNARGEVIGLAFDGNIHSLGGEFGYEPAVNRAIAVSTAAISEALVRIYGQERLARELSPPRALSGPASGT